MEFNEVWENTLAYLLEDKYSEFQLSKLQKAWLSLIDPLTITEGFALLSVPNNKVLEMVENHLKKKIARVLSREIGRDVEIAVRIALPHEFEEELQQESPQLPSHHSSEAALPPSRDSQENNWSGYFDDNTLVNKNIPEEPTYDAKTRLSTKYTFDNFVIGSSNRFAHAASFAIAEAPAQAYNPLFIWGQSGLGKTHLLHAAGHYTKKLYPKIRIRYVSTEEFTNDFINSLKDDRRDTFKKQYREIDVLLIDDIQFLEGKEGIQEEFFHTFNTLHTSGKQIVISSDRHPRKLSTLEDRLRTRFEWGLLTDVQPPELETRLAILRKKASSEHIAIPNAALELIAEKIDRNIRELEGALIRVIAYASLNGVAVTAELTETVIKDLIPHSSIEVNAQTIMSVTAEFFGINMDELVGNSKTRVITSARQIAMYLCREMTDLSLPKIGQLFLRDHTTVMYADRKVRTEMAAQRKVYEQIQELTSKIKLRASS